MKEKRRRQNISFLQVHKRRQTGMQLVDDCVCHDACRKRINARRERKKCSQTGQAEDLAPATADPSSVFVQPQRQKLQAVGMPKPKSINRRAIRRSDGPDRRRRRNKIGRNKAGRAVHSMNIVFEKQNERKRNVAKWPAHYLVVMPKDCW